MRATINSFTLKQNYRVALRSTRLSVDTIAHRRAANYNIYLLRTELKIIDRDIAVTVSLFRSRRDRIFREHGNFPRRMIFTLISGWWLRVGSVYFTRETRGTWLLLNTKCVEAYLRWIVFCNACKCQRMRSYNFIRIEILNKSETPLLCVSIFVSVGLTVDNLVPRSKKRP